MRARALLPLIDEFFIEVHFAHASMSVHGWDGFRTTREEARALLADLRRDGVYAHSWP